MAELANCKGCGKLFVKTESSYCPTCLKEQEKKFDIVYDYIKTQDHRQATVSQVHEATGVEEELIYTWVKKGRLMTSDFINLGYPCRSCGKIIHTGDLCDSCKKKLSRDFEAFTERERAEEERKRGKTYYTT